jgi:hypothetical protein
MGMEWRRTRGGRGEKWVVDLKKAVTTRLPCKGKKRNNNRSPIYSEKTKRGNFPGKETMSSYIMAEVSANPCRFDIGYNIASNSYTITFLDIIFFLI